MIDKFVLPLIFFIFFLRKIPVHVLPVMLSCQSDQVCELHVFT